VKAFTREERTAGLNPEYWLHDCSHVGALLFDLSDYEIGYCKSWFLQQSCGIHVDFPYSSLMLTSTYFSANISITIMLKSLNAFQKS
jgi:hypothetical protein